MNARIAAFLAVLAAYAPAASASTIDPEVIDAVVHEHRDAIRDCYHAGLDRKPRLRGKLLVLMTVERDGSVREAIAKSSTVDDAEVEECVLGVFDRMHFPDLTGGCDASVEDCAVKITYPLTFTP